jgi:hypothetical protein
MASFTGPGEHTVTGIALEEWHKAQCCGMRGMRDSGVVCQLGMQ